MKNGIAFFDFDGTITTKDTLLEFIKFSKGKFRFLKGFFLNSHYLVAYKLKLISNQKAKEKIMHFFFGNMPLSVFQEKCDQFIKEILPGLIRPKAYEEFEKLKQKGILIVIVSASPENWITKWAQEIAISIIATQLEVSNNLITGKISGINCHGQEKVRRIKEVYNLAEFKEIYAYGDSSGDKPMLALANYSFMKPFR